MKTCSSCNMEGTIALTLSLLVLGFVSPGEAKRTRSPLLSSIPEDCRTSELHVTPDQPAWIVSPGHAVAGVTDGSQQICKWSIKAPPGHGVVIEVADLRLRRSRRCSVSRVQIQPGLSVEHARLRPLARFCGRGPKNPLWKTTFSQIYIEYKSSATARRKAEASNEILTSSGKQTSEETSSSSQSPKSQKLARIKALQRLYNLRSSDQKAGQSSRYQTPSQTSQHYKSYGQNNRRYYRHSNTTGIEVNETIVIDGEDFVYDEESDAFGSVTGVSASPTVRLFSVGEPTWITTDFILHDGLNVTDLDFDHPSANDAKKHKKQKKNRKNSKRKKGGRRREEKVRSDLRRQENVGSDLTIEDDSLERIPRSAWAPSRTTYQRSSRRSYHRTRYYTVTRGRPSRKQYRVTISHHDPPTRPTPSPKPQRALVTSYPRSRGHNEIIPHKPTKPHIPQGSKEVYYPSKTFGYLNPKPEVPKTEKPATHGGHVRKERFVFKVRSFRSHCGGEISADRGRFTSPGYPQKMGGRNSCFWRFKTPPGSHWKLQCTHFRIRKSRNCVRDHLAIRINEADWTRYCGREGPSLALTSTHTSFVDVVLNTFRNESARTICSWETDYIGGGQNSYGYRRYWSYNLTRITTPPPTTTTTTTTTTTLPPPPLAYQQRWGCNDYKQLTSDHTMCRSTPPTCSIYLEGLTSSERDSIIDSHNKYRALVARGEESEGLPGPQYSAADMQQLVWNEELAQVAQAWASACPDYHDCQDCRRVLSRNYYVGQNIFYEWSSSNAGSVWDTAVRLWYEEVKYVPNYLTKSFRMMDHAVIGHYTQLVWAETREIGCGATYHDCSKVFKGRLWKLKCKIYVCNYGPTGNYVRKPMYTIGPPASACPAGTRPSMTYPGLCTLR